MYVDRSRLQDLKRLNDALKDPKVPLLWKQKAHKSLKRIMRELKNPYLAKQRERLIKAGDAGDKHESWKIATQIRDYLKQEKLEEGTN